MNKIISGLLIALGILGAGFFVGSSIKYFKNFDRYVEVKGLSEKIVKSDLANWQIGFNLSGSDLAQVYKDIDGAQQKVIAFLLKQGFEQSDIQKQPISVMDNYANAYNNNSANEKLPRYNATAGVTVTTKKVDNMVTAMQNTNSLIEAGVLLSNNLVTYSYTDLNTIKTAMLNDALTNAKKAAQEFANNSNSSIGKIRQAGQGVFTIGSLNGDYNDPTSITKKVRVVTTVQYFVK